MMTMLRHLIFCLVLICRVLSFDRDETIIGNGLVKGNYVFPYSGPLLFVQPDLRILDTGVITAFELHASHAINQRTQQVVKPLHFVVFRPADSSNTRFHIVAMKSVSDLSGGNMLVHAGNQVIQVFPGDRLGFMAEGQVPIAATYLGRDRSSKTKKYTFTRRLSDPKEADVGRTFLFDHEEPCIFSFRAMIRPHRARAGEVRSNNNRNRNSNQTTNEQFTSETKLPNINQLPSTTTTTTTAVPVTESGNEVNPKPSNQKKGDVGVTPQPGMVGATGAKGNTGSTGPQGIKGDQGAKGARGYKGESGVVVPPASTSRGFKISPSHLELLKKLQEDEDCTGITNACMQNCRRTQLSHKCYCNEGYTLEADMLTCTDIDECQILNGGCQGTCENSPGSFNCSCPSAFTLSPDGRSCAAVSQCGTSADDCEEMGGICVDTRGSHQCLRDTAQHGHVVMVDVDPEEGCEDCMIDLLSDAVILMMIIWLVVITILGFMLLGCMCTRYRGDQQRQKKRRRGLGAVTSPL